MQAIAHGALQCSIQAALDSAQTPASGALQQCGDGGGHQGQQQRPGGGPTHQQHAGQVDHHRQQGLQHAHRLVHAQGGAVDVGHEQRQQIPAAELIQLVGGC